jgi:DNA polymerase III subunit beta
MEFVIKQSALKEELGFVQGIVEKKSTIPVLSNILIESVGEGTIRIVGTDLDVTIRCEATADIKQSGAMCIQARKLFDIVRLLDGGEVHFTKEENEWVKMSCGKSKFRLAGVNREQFPEVPSFKSAPLKISAEIFNHFINTTAFAITNEQSRFTLSGAKGHDRRTPPCVHSKAPWRRHNGHDGRFDSEKGSDGACQNLARF